MKKRIGWNCKKIPLRKQKIHSKSKPATPSFHSKIKGSKDLLDPFSDPWTTMILNIVIEFKPEFLLNAAYLPSTNYTSLCCNNLRNFFCYNQTKQLDEIHNSWILCQHRVQTNLHVNNDDHVPFQSCVQFHEQLAMYY